MGRAKEAYTTTKSGRPAKHIKRRVRGYSDIVAALPEVISSKLTFSRDVYTKSYALTKWMTAYGLSVLDTHEYILLQFIAARTLHFGKLAEMITKDHFLRGVWCDDELICSPVRMGPSVLYRTIRSLEDKQVISVLPVKLNGRDLPTIYEIEIDFITTLRPSEDVMSKLREPKQKPKTADIVDFEAFRQAKLSNLSGSTRNHLTPKEVVLPRTTNIINKNNEDNEVVAAASHSNENALRVRRKPRAASTNEIDCNASAREVINVVLSRSTNKREAKVARAARGAAIALSDLNATWKKAMIAAFGSCTIAGLTTKEYGMFKRIVKAHEISCTWLEFFTWAIDHWSAINNEYRNSSDFRKRKDGDWSLKQEDVLFLGSDTPDLFQTVKNFPKLLKRYSQHTLTGKVSAQQRDDSREVEALKKELADTRKQASTNAALVKRMMTGGDRKPVATVNKARPVKIVNPDTDSFFEGSDSELKEWK